MKSSLKVVKAARFLNTKSISLSCKGKTGKITNQLSLILSHYLNSLSESRPHCM